MVNAFHRVSLGTCYVAGLVRCQGLGSALGAQCQAPVTDCKARSWGCNSVLKRNTANQYIILYIAEYILDDRTVSIIQLQLGQKKRPVLFGYVKIHL